MRVTKEASADLGRSVLGLHGVVDLPETRRLEGQAREAAIAGHRHLVVDLTGVTDIRAGLIGALLRIWRELRRVDGRLVVIAPRSPAADILRAARLDVLMEGETGVPDARRRLAVPPTDPGCD